MAGLFRFHRFLLPLLLIAALVSTSHAKPQPVVIDLWSQMTSKPNREAFEALAERYNRENPGVEVRLLTVPQMHQKLLTAIVGGTPPDVAIYDRFRLAGLAHRGALMPLDEMAREAGVDVSDFWQAPLDECRYEGKLYALPVQTDVRVLFYNKAAFREAGLDPDRPPQTWKELREYSERLTIEDEDGDIRQAGFVPFFGFGNTYLYLYGWQKGAEYLSADGRRAQLNTQEVRDALKWIHAFMESYGGADRMGLFRQGAGGVGPLMPFMVETVAMTVTEPSLLSNIRRYTPDLGYGLAPMPWPEDGVRATWSGGFALVIPEGVPHPEESMKFVAWLTSKEVQAEYGEMAFQIPGNRRATETPYYQQDPDMRALIEEMPYSRHRPVTPVGAIMWDGMLDAWVAGAKGEDPDMVLGRAEDKVQRALDSLYSEEALPTVSAKTLVGSIVLVILGIVGWREIGRAS